MKPYILFFFLFLFLNFDHKSKQNKPDLFIFSVGVSKYKDTRLNLQYAHLDAIDLATAFGKQTALYNIQPVKVLVNEQATRAAIREGLKTLRAKATQNDLVIFIFSGHGLEETLVPYDFNVSDELGTAIQKSDLFKLLDGIGCNYIVMIDACHSGSFAKKVLGKDIYYANYQREVEQDVINLIEGLSQTDKAKMVIGSSASNEKSFECISCKHGYFTQCVLDIFKNKGAINPNTNRKHMPDANNDGKVSLTEFSNYLEVAVQAITYKANQLDENVEIQKIHSRTNKTIDVDFLHVGPGQVSSASINGDGTAWRKALPVLVRVNGGSYIMGSPDRKGNEFSKPQHNVTIKNFWIGKYEVTNLEYSVFLNERGNQMEYLSYGGVYDYNRNWIDIEEKGTQIEYKNGMYIPKSGYESYPVIKVTWRGAKAFCSWLSERTGENYRLLSEAEWEYAARGGSLSKGFTYSGSNNLKDVGWYNGNVDGYSGWLPNKVYSQPVGKKQPNELGIFDMSGNVSEWVEDNYVGSYDDNDDIGFKAPIDGSPAVINIPEFHKFDRVQRGGSWFVSDYQCTIWDRYLGGENTSWLNVGFRVAKDD